MAKAGESDAKHLAALRRHWKANKSFPSMGILRKVLGLSSTSSVFVALGRLAKQGYLVRVNRRIAPGSLFFERAILGRVRAGAPEVEEQRNGDGIRIDDFLVDDPNATMLLRVRGDSMKDAGIQDGDTAIVKTTGQPRAGNIVVAQVDGEYTVKYLRQDRRRNYFLEAANPAFPIIRPSATLEIVGIVTGSFRRYA